MVLITRICVDFTQKNFISPSLAVACTGNHLKELFFGPLFPKTLDCFLLLNSLRSPILVNKRPEEEDEAAKRKTQERDLERQKGEKTGDARGPATDHHGGASHAGCCSCAHCCVCLCSNSSKYNRMMPLFRLSGFGVLILSRAKRNSVPLS